MLDSIYHIMTIFFGMKISRFCHLLRNIIMDLITFPENMLTISGLSILLHSLISLPEATSCDKLQS